MTPEKEQWQARFLKALAERPIITRAAKKAGICRATAYNHKEADPDFKAAWENALEEGVDGLVDTAWGRALDGESDTLTIFLLKNHRPSVYKETVRQEHTGGDGGPLTFREVVVELPPDDA